MQLRRKKLALLISLIGAGVSPYAYARGDLRVAGAPESPLNIALDDSATWAEAPAWHSPDGTLELVNLPDDLQESMQLPPSSVQASDDAPEAAHQTPEEFSDAAPGEVTREPRGTIRYASSKPAQDDGIVVSGHVGLHSSLFRQHSLCWPDLEHRGARANPQRGKGAVLHCGAAPRPRRVFRIL